MVIQLDLLDLDLLDLLRTPGMVYRMGVDSMAPTGITTALKALLELVQLRTPGTVLMTGVDSKPSTGKRVNSHLLA